MGKLHIHRHNEAARTIINAINKGKHGSFLVSADVGSVAMLADLEVHHKRIPTWVLPNSELNSIPHDVTPNPTRNKMRPDMMVVEFTRQEKCNYSNAEDNADLPS